MAPTGCLKVTQKEGGAGAMVVFKDVNRNVGFAPHVDGIAFSDHETHYFNSSFQFASSTQAAPQPKSCMVVRPVESTFRGAMFEKKTQEKKRRVVKKVSFLIGTTFGEQAYGEGVWNPKKRDRAGVDLVEKFYDEMEEDESEMRKKRTRESGYVPSKMEAPHSVWSPKYGDRSLKVRCMKLFDVGVEEHKL